jgi:Repeat of unknown function (DUF346)
MHPLCATRAVKVLKYLHRTVPQTISRSSLHALEKLPSGLLAGLHTVSDWDKVTEDAQLKSWLANNAIPSPQTNVSGPLFHGNLVFAQVSFAAPGLAPSGISAADTQTAIDYATLAVVPIQRYASQYGPNSVSVWPVAIPYTARVQGGAFSRDDFEGWVDDIAQFMRSQQVGNPCIVIMHNRSLPNSPSFTNERNSHHCSTSNGTPYCYSLVFDENLSIADNNHTVNGKANEKVYAHNLSHEIAEMVVDPLAGEGNPEVCDACSTNCNSFSLFELFDQNGFYIGGTADTASASGFAFFINSIVRSDVALNPADGCIVGGGTVQSACIYPPPFNYTGAAWAGTPVVSWAPNRLDIFGLGVNNDMFHKWWDGSSWGPSQADWEPLGGIFNSPPAAVAWAPDRLDIFGLGVNNDMFHKWWDGGSWGPSQTDWETLGGTFNSPPVVVSWAPGRLDIFGLGVNNEMLHKWWDPAWLGSDGTHWGPSQTDWEPLGGIFNSPPAAVAWAPDRLDIFGLGVNNDMFHKWWDGSSWGPSQTDWETLGGTFNSPPAVVSWAPGRLDIFGLGVNNDMFHKWWDGSSWGPSQTDWEWLGGTFNSPPAVVSWAPNRLDIFGLGVNNEMLHKWRDGSSWGPSQTGWETLGGIFNRL